MRSGTTTVLLAGLVTVSGIAFAFVRGGVPSPVAEAQAATGAGVEVDDLADHPELYSGEVILRAAVARVNRSKGLLSVIDAREFESCGEVNCARHYLPVKIDGPLPDPKTVVTLTGRIAHSEEGLVFEASRVEVRK